THMIALFVLGLFIVVVGNTISTTASQGLVPDCVPVRQRGAASGFMGLMTLLGTVGSLALASILLGQATNGGVKTGGVALGSALYYAIAAGVLVVFAAIPLFAIKENRWTRRNGHDFAKKSPEGHAQGEQSAGGFRLAGFLRPWRHANFRWVFLTRGFVMLGLALFMTYIEYYFARVGGRTDFVQATAVIAILSLLGAVASTLLMGVLSDRIGKRAPIVAVASAFMAAAALMFVLAPAQTALWPLGICFGLGYGAYMSVDVALAVDALPSLHAAGQDLGIWSMASTLPGVVAPVLGSGVIVLASVVGQTASGYRGIFALATLFLILGALLVLKVRESRGHGNGLVSRSDKRDGADQSSATNVTGATGTPDTPETTNTADTNAGQSSASESEVA
ncbi:MAG TPA: MFS transporter, partial [Ktedonobacterales bacterium]|nr:MFS transporter [Ktedonobacterales bacterium]